MRVLTVLQSPNWKGFMKGCTYISNVFLQLERYINASGTIMFTRIPRGPTDLRAPIVVSLGNIKWVQPEPIFFAIPDEVMTVTKGGLVIFKSRKADPGVATTATPLTN